MANRITQRERERERFLSKTTHERVTSWLKMVTASTWV